MPTEVRLPFGRHEVTEEDIQAVIESLRSNALTQGPVVERFESKLARVCQTTDAIALSSGTAALYVAFQVLECDSQTEVFTTPITFAATTNAALALGATPVFVDIDLQTFNLDVGCLEDALKRSRAHKKIVVPVHFSGVACDLDEIASLAQVHGARVLEDASHALGATYRGKPIGGTHPGHLSVFSFHPVKHVTTGEGGAIVSSDPESLRRARVFRTHGIVKSGFIFENENRGPWYQEQQLLGLNWRMPEMGAALGESQISRLAENLANRRAIAKRYDEGFVTGPFILPRLHHPERESSWLLYVLQAEFDDKKRSKAEFMRRLSQAGIHTQVHQIPVYRHPYYRSRLGDLRMSYPNAETYYRRALSIPMYPGLTETEQSYVIERCLDAWTALAGC